MSLPSLFQVLQLAYGPSLLYTMGPFKAGQYFRTQLIGIPHHEDNRIVVEFFGNFCRFGKELSSDVALVSALGGFSQENSVTGLRDFYDNIKKTGSFLMHSKIWPFTIDSDLIFRKENHELPNENTIRFHLLSPDQNILIQAEYIVSNTGHVYGPGSYENSNSKSESNSENDVTSFSNIINTCQRENLTLVEYVLSYEEHVHSVDPVQTRTKMEQIWKIIKASVESGLQQDLAGNMYKTYHDRLANYEIIGNEQALASIYALAVCEESRKNKFVVATPVCETAGILPAVLNTLQEKYHFYDEKIADALVIAGFVGSYLMQINVKNNTNIYFSTATAMASAGGLSLLSSDLGILNEVVNIAISLSDSKMPFTSGEITNLNIKHSNLAIEAINLGLNGFQLSKSTTKKPPPVH
ncbi:MAG: L-serine ammonia-lyase, iron-sulfur-dependent, subunit alpha [Bacteroidota bacterium]|nr:L-serine ammonia-lyase, iron-sulfur-dependent, subunit alpha [Bacteroidota bacterium]